jgi:endonuclease/exonuclease/phosphatase (EEP) superfamily protein YafD
MYVEWWLITITGIIAILANYNPRSASAFDKSYGSALAQFIAIRRIGASFILGTILLFLILNVTLSLNIDSHSWGFTPLSKIFFTLLFVNTITVAVTPKYYGRKIGKLRSSTSERLNPSGTLKVFTSNMLRENTDKGDGISRSILRENPDVIVLTEVVDEFKENLAKVYAQYPYSISFLIEEYAGEECSYTLLSKIPFITSEVLQLKSQRPLLTATIKLGEETVRLVAIHTNSPMVRNRVKHWALSLEELNEQVAKWTEPLIMLGDYNATPAHSIFSQLITRGGLVDISNSKPTWPTMPYRISKNLSIPSPRVLALDHILVRGFNTVSVKIGENKGSDHSSITAQISLVSAKKIVKSNWLFEPLEK